MCGVCNHTPPKISSIEDLEKKNKINLEKFDTFIKSISINCDCIMKVRPNNKGWNKINNKHYHHTFSFLYEYIEKNNFSYNLFISENFQINNPDKSKILQLNDLFEYVRINSLLNYGKDTYKILNFKLLDNILNFSKKITSNIEYIKYMLFYLITLIEAYEKLFLKIQTKVIFLECYYDVTNLALCYVGEKNSIKTIDIQHAIQVDTHYMYTNFSAIPREGYSLLPDYFWIWSEYRKDRIENWANNTIKHKILIGGNIPYIHKFSKKNTKFYNDFFPKNKINILLALDLEISFKNFIIDAIKKVSDEYLWHLRDHPAQGQNLIEKKILKNIFSLNNIEYLHNNKSPLLEFAHNIDISITFNSTVSYELRDIYKIPSIIITEDKKLIDKNGIFFARDLDEFLLKLDFITKNLSQIKKRLRPEEIVINEEYINASIKKILN